MSAHGEGTRASGVRNTLALVNGLGLNLVLQLADAAGVDLTRPVVIGAIVIAVGVLVGIVELGTRVLVRQAGWITAERARLHPG